MHGRLVYQTPPRVNALGFVLDRVLNGCVLDNGWYTIATSGGYVGVAFPKVVVNNVRTVSVV